MTWDVHHRCQGGCTNGRGKYIYVLYNMFVHFTQCAPRACFYWGVCSVYFLYRIGYATATALYLRLYWCLCAYYKDLYVDIFVYVIQYNFWLYFIWVVFAYIYPMYGLFFHCIVFTFAFVFICLLILDLFYCDMLVYFITVC